MKKQARSLKFKIRGFGRFQDLLPESRGHAKLTPPRALLRLTEDGWTLIEMMIVLALMAIIVPAVSLLFAKVTQAYASDEMHLLLKTANEHAMLRLHERLTANKHMFQNNASGTSFVPLIQFAATDPPVLAGSLLPLSQPSTVSSFSPNAHALPADFGNSILFCAYDFPQTLNINGTITTTTAPLTIWGPGTNTGYNPPTTITTTVNYNAGNGGGPATVILDVYRFYYYYLSANNDKPLPGVASYRLVEWESQQYADEFEINSITDGTVQQAVISWLSYSTTIGGKVVGNFPGAPITLAYDPTQTTPNPAAGTFFSLSGSTKSAITAAIARAQCNVITQVSSGIISNGFNYGVCGNTAGWINCPPVTVPEFGTSAGAFPGGFEVGILGNGAGMQLLTRCLLVAQGAAPKVAWYDDTGVTNTKDLW